MRIIRRVRRLVRLATIGLTIAAISQEMQRAPSDRTWTGVVFGVETNVPVKGSNAAQRREHDKRLGAGTMSRAGVRCPCCPAIMTMEDIRLEGHAGRLGTIMTVVVVDGQRGKEYRRPTYEEILIAADAGRYWAGGQSGSKFRQPRLLYVLMFD